jgi:hypothetical protein
MSGSYPLQTVTKNFTSPGVTVVGQSASGVVIADLETFGDNATYQNMTINAGLVHNCTCPAGHPYNVALYNVNFRAVNTGGNPYSTVQIQSGTNISWNGGDFGPAPIGQGQAEPLEIATYDGTDDVHNVVINGLNFHDVYRTPSCDAASCHTEVIRVDDGVVGWTIKNSTFQDMSPTEGVNSGCIFVGSRGTSADRATGGLIENNFFGSCAVNGFAINGGQCPQIQSNKVSYNTARNIQLITGGAWSGCQGSVSLVANLGDWINACNFTDDHNVWFGSTGSCGSDKFVAGSDVGFSDEWHLASNSPAIDAGSKSYCPANDHDGGSRPVGPACDSGADEFGSG